MKNGNHDSGNWTLGNSLEIIMGHQNTTEKKLAQAQGTIPMILSGDLKNTKHIPIKIYTTRERLQEKKLEQKILAKERVLIALSWPGTVGKIGIFRGEALHSKATAAFIPKEQMNIDFLFYMLKYMKQDITYEVNVQGRTSITLKRLNNLPMPPLPSLEEQGRLADQLDALFQKVERERDSLEKTQKTTDQLLHDTLQAAFAPTNIASWRKFRLGDLVTLIKQPLIPQASQYAQYLYIDDTCIKPERGELDRKLVWGEQQRYRHQAKNLVQNAHSSVIYVRTSPAKRRAALLDINEGLCHQNIAVLRVAEGHQQDLLPEFLLWTLLSPPFTLFATNGHPESSAPISEHKLLSFEIPLPPRNVQRHLVKRLNAVQEATRKMLERLTQSTTKIQQIEQQILQKYFQRN